MKNKLLIIITAIALFSCKLAVINNNTILTLENKTKDSVLCYVTLGAMDTNKYIANVKGIFGITTSGLQGSVYLKPDSIYTYQTPANFGISGNLSFSIPPSNCPDTTLYPTGNSLFEFVLNNYLDKGTETVDISAVAGVNSRVQCNLSGGGIWNAGDSYPSVTTFSDTALYYNTGRVGVYPYGCDNCTSITSPPNCPGHKSYAKPQAHKMCNVQRNSGTYGGSVKVKYLGNI